MKQFILYILIIFMITFTGCGDKAANLQINEAYKYKNSLAKLDADIKYVELTLDSGNINIYFWDKSEIKYEAKHTARANITEDKLTKLLKKFVINIEERENLLKLSVKYNKKPSLSKQEFFTDLKLFLPRKIKGIEIVQKKGNLTVEDKYDGNISAELDSVKTEIKAMKGQLVLECDNGNMTLNSGRLSSGSKIIINNGNIFAKTDCENKAKYIFETQTGNVDLNFPSDSNIFIKSYGTVKNNQFLYTEGSTEVNVSSNMGLISINGY